jgi:hypothetical protein
MIQNAINSAFAGAWQNIVYYASFSFVDPFWFWALMLFLAFWVIGIITFFFGQAFPVIRTIGGSILVVFSFGLFAFFWGEKRAREHDEAKKPKPQPVEVDSYRRYW